MGKSVGVTVYRRDGAGEEKAPYAVPISQCSREGYWGSGEDLESKVGRGLKFRQGESDFTIGGKEARGGIVVSA